MPATFLIFISIVVYLALVTLIILIFAPLLFIPTKRPLAKKAIGTILISLPCLIITTIGFLIIFIAPGLLYLYIVSIITDPPTFVIGLTVILFLLFALSLALVAIYLWYLTSRLLYQRIEHRPYSEITDNDKVLNFIRPYIYKLNFLPVDKIIHLIMRTQR